MLNEITQLSGTAYPRAISPSREGGLNQDKLSDITQKYHDAVNQKQSEKLRQEGINAAQQRQDKKINERREATQEASIYQAKRDIPSYAVGHTESQASQLADKLARDVQLARKEKLQKSGEQSPSHRRGQQVRLEQAYQPANPIEARRFVDEIV